MDWDGLGQDGIEKRENWWWREERFNNVDGVGRDRCLRRRFCAFSGRHCPGGRSGGGCGCHCCWGLRYRNCCQRLLLSCFTLSLFTHPVYLNPHQPSWRCVDLSQSEREEKRHFSKQNNEGT